MIPAILRSSSPSRLAASSIAKRALLPCVTHLPATCGSVHGMLCRYQSSAKEQNVILLGAGGRDFHDFQVYWSKQPNVCVQAMTCAAPHQIGVMSSLSSSSLSSGKSSLFPKELCHNDQNGNRYPQGVEIHPEANLERLIRKASADTTTTTTCALAYSDQSYDTVQSLASRVNAVGGQFVQLPPHATMLHAANTPVVAVCGSRTGVGKSQTSRYIAQYLKKRHQNLNVVVIHHPIRVAAPPKDDGRFLRNRAVQRFATLEDLDVHHCTLKEREEYGPHLVGGTVVFSGVDYESILREAEKETDVILWDGGNNDVPFLKPDLHITLVDSLRPVDEEHYYPGETNVRMADLILITKVDQLLCLKKAQEHAHHLEEQRHLTKTPNIPIFYAVSVVTPEATDHATGKPLGTRQAAKLVEGKRVLVVEDGSTLTRGGVPYGAGHVLAHNLEAAELVDPRPYAQGSVKAVLDAYPHLKNVVPAMMSGGMSGGHEEEQQQQMADDLAATIRATPCDTVVLGTPINNILGDLEIPQPTVQARYELKLVNANHEQEFHAALDAFVADHCHHHDDNDDGDHAA